MSADDESLAPTLELVERYIVGELPVVEAERVAAYFAAHASAAVALDVLRRSVSFVGDAAGDTNQRWTELVARLDALGDGREGSQRGRERVSRAAQSREAVPAQTMSEGVTIPKLRRVLSAGRVSERENSANHGGRGMRVSRTQTLRGVLWTASVLIVVALASVVILSRGPSHAGTTHTYTTRAGQQATLTLIDGTRVTLAPRTTVSLVRFSDASRTVTLTGQAYFEVAKSTGAPFLVRAGSVTTQVLGTAFLVRHYIDDAQVHIAVAEGKVNVTSARPGRPLSSPLLLTAGHIGDLTDSTIIVNAVGDLSSETDWLQGQLVFRSAPVGEVLQMLSRWYGYQFRCDDPALTRRSVTLALDAQSSAAALSSLERLLSVYITVVGDTVTLTPRPNKSTEGSTRTHTYDVWTPTREVGR